MDVEFDGLLEFDIDEVIRNGIMIEEVIGRWRHNKKW